MQQIDALPYGTIRPHGDIEVMLTTSRNTGRWIIPKGNPIPGLKAHQAAEREAFEEAGINGKVSKWSIGKFRYSKQRPDRRWFRQVWEGRVL